MQTRSAQATLERVSTAEAYVAALDDALVGPARVRRGLVQEARDHLEDATDALRRAGHDRSYSEQQAVADFGALDEIVPAFQTALAVASARRTAWMLLVVLSAQPFLWDGPLGPVQKPNPDGVVYSILDRGVEYGGGLMILFTLALVVATGVGNRWFAAGRGIARVTSFTALAAAVSIKVTGVSMLLLSSGGDPALWLLLVVFIVVPFSVTATQARRTLAIC